MKKTTFLIMTAMLIMSAIAQAQNNKYGKH